MQHAFAQPAGPVGYVAIEQPFGVEPPVVHCPICGHAQSVLEGDEYLQTPCAHLAFVFGGEEDEFIYASEDFAARFARFDAALQARFPDAESQNSDAFEEASRFYRDLFPTRLAEMGYGSQLLALRITYGGMADGAPVWFSDVYGFDYATLQEPPR
ncbi:hypothetical protein [Pseudomonas sp. NW5]|uniref:hypothetical protein n=1 Tax=Pseudomonas sp. NW5 TaxID=2934934 RepID=UPI00202112BA|nr:hypothetical protein [Pseudomonas sp. NW5]MCL7461785.1 hypothetical protein [Pseudomonas sp. NW5]